MKKQLEVGKTYPTYRMDCEVTILTTEITIHAPAAGLFHHIPTGEKHIACYDMEGKNESPDRTLDLIIPEPEPQWRPWKIEEIPLGGMIRKKATDAVSLIIAINPESKTQIATAGMYLSAELAYAKYEYHNGTSWQPCGVLVS